MFSFWIKVESLLPADRLEQIFSRCFEFIKDNFSRKM